jgi:hypothetical protein
MFEPASIAPPDTLLPVLAQPSGYYKIRSRSSGKVLDVPGRSANPGVKIQQFTNQTGESNNQVWQLRGVPEVPETHPITEAAG